MANYTFSYVHNVSLSRKLKFYRGKSGLCFVFFIWTHLNSGIYRSHIGNVKVWCLGTSLFSKSGPSKTKVELACPTHMICVSVQTIQQQVAGAASTLLILLICYVCAAEVKMKNQRRLYFKRLLKFSRPVRTCPLQLTKLQNLLFTLGLRGTHSCSTRSRALLVFALSI